MVAGANRLFAGHTGEPAADAAGKIMETKMVKTNNTKTPIKWTAAKIQALKGRQKIACLTAYDYAFAKLVDEAGIPLILVGDSVGTTMLGFNNTLPVTMEIMLHHTAAAARGAQNALVVADMPFLSYQISEDDAIRNAGRFIQEAGAGAVKIEGGAFRAPLIRRLVQNGIPVLAHIGLTPQNLRVTGGYKVQGRRPAESAGLLRDARALEAAGAFALVLECMPAALGKRLTQALNIPTIGIGAGPGCDGQIMVLHDMLGLSGKFQPKFVKRYAELGATAQKALTAYRNEVENGQYPTKEHTY